MWYFAIAKRITEVTCPVILAIYNILVTLCALRDKNVFIIAVYYSATMTLFSLLLSRISYKDVFLMIFMYAFLSLPIGTIFMIQDCVNANICCFLIGMYTFHLGIHAFVQVYFMRRALIATQRVDINDNITIRITR